MTFEELKLHIEPIARLSHEEFSLLQPYIISKELKRGEKVLEEGETCRAFYFVEKGYLRNYYNKSGTALNLGFAFEGEFISNLESYTGRKPSQLEIEAGEKSTVWIFNMRQVPEQYKAISPIGDFIRRIAIRILMTSQEHTTLLAIYTPTERYHYLRENNPQLLQRISLTQMASYVGVARETLSRIRAKKG